MNRKTSNLRQIIDHFLEENNHVTDHYTLTAEDLSIKLFCLSLELWNRISIEYLGRHINLYCLY